MQFGPSLGTNGKEMSLVEASKDSDVLGFQTVVQTKQVKDVSLGMFFNHYLKCFRAKLSS